MYSWRNAPVFEALTHRLRRMLHEGRLSVSRLPKSKLSGVLFVLPEDAVFLEHPVRSRRLSEDMRRSLCSYPWFDLTHSILDWKKGDAALQLALQRNMISELEASFDDLGWG